MSNQYRLDEYGDVLSPKDIHDILGIGYNKTYELLNNGEIKSFKIGRERKVPKHCLESFITKMLDLSGCGDT